MRTHEQGTFQERLSLCVSRGSHSSLFLSRVVFFVCLALGWGGGDVACVARFLLVRRQLHCSKRPAVKIVDFLVKHPSAYGIWKGYTRVSAALPRLALLLIHWIRFASLGCSVAFHRLFLSLCLLSFIAFYLRRLKTNSAQNTPGGAKRQGPGPVLRRRAPGTRRHQAPRHHYRHLSVRHQERPPRPFQCVPDPRRGNSCDDDDDEDDAGDIASDCRGRRRRRRQWQCRRCWGWRRGRWRSSRVRAG